MSIKAKFGLGSMINKAVKFMMQNYRDLKKRTDSAKSQGINRYVKRFCTSGKKTLECLNFFGKLMVPIGTGVQTIDLDSKVGGRRKIQNGIAFSYACRRFESKLCRIVCGTNSQLHLSAVLGVMIFLNLHTFAYAGNAASLHRVSGERTFVVNSTDEYTPYRFRFYNNENNVSATEYEIRYQVSERTNDGNWTDSAIVRGSAAKSQVGEPINAQALPVSLANGHGTWYVTGPTHVTGTEANCCEWINALANQRVTFVPGTLSQKIKKGDKVEVRIRVATWYKIPTWVKVDDDYQSVVLGNHSSTALSWEANNSLHIVPDGTSTYGELDGLVTNRPVFNFPLKYGGYEIKPDGTRTLVTVGATREITSKYSGWDVPVGENLQYGSWVASRHHDKFLFRPNSVEINKLGSGQTVFSALEVTPIDGNGNPIGDKQTIRVVIGKFQIGVFWDDGTELDDVRNSKIATAEIPNTFTDVTGFMETDFRQILRGGQASSKNKWRFSLYEDKSPETDDDVPPVDEAILNNPNRKWNTDIVTYGVEEVTELAGTETKVGDSASSGTWYISEADGYTGTNYLAHTSTRQFLFRPNIDVLGEMRDGSSFVSYLRIQKGWCNVINFPRNTDCSIHNSEFDGEIESAKIIAAKVTRQKTFVISINDISLAEGDGSGSTEYAFKVSIDSEAGVPYGFAVPVTFNHVSSNTEDFMTGQSLSGLDVAFDPMDTEKTIPIMVEKDDSEEPDETFELRLSQPTGEAVNKKLVQLFEELGANVGTGTIIDDDRAQISINDVTQAEGSEGTTTEFQFTVSLSPEAAVNQTFTVPITFEHVSTSPGDFMTDPALATLDVSFSATDTSKDVSVILVNQDTDGEENERFTLTLSEPTGNAKTMNLVTLSNTPGATVGTGIISDDDAKRLTTTWLAGFDGKIVNDGSGSQYRYQVAYYADDIPFAATFDSSERKNGIVINSTPNAGFTSVSLDETRYPEFTGSNSTISRSTGKTTYGQWYERRQATGCPPNNQCYHVLFIPNSEAINQLVPGDIVTSTYRRQTWHEGYEASSVTVTISANFGSNIIGFDYDSRSIAAAESEESADLDVFISEAMDDSVTISYRVADGTAHSDSDFIPESPATLTIPAGATSATISIPVTDDSAFENTEEFTVHLQDSAEFRITPVLQSAKVTILDDDPPTIVPPGGSVCKVDTKPASVMTPNTEAYWEIGAPVVDGEQVVYRAAYDKFDVRIGFRDHVAKTPETPDSNNTFYFAIYYDNGEPENPGIPKEAQSTWGGVGHTIGQPGDFRGYLRYRILPRNVTDDSWYFVGDPCEFHIWWTDANRPGITLSADETVKEGRPIRVTATATPIPNRDILVPVTLSEDPRIAGERSFTVKIRAGQASGHVDVPTNFMPNNQPSDDVTVSTEWRSTYWLDDSRKSTTVTLEDHDQRFVSFTNADPDIEVVESETAVLPVSFTGTNSAGVTVKYRIDDVDTDSMDYTAVANPEVTIATGNEGMISIPISADMEFEDSESFTVTIIESDDALPGNSNFTATVTVISDDGASPTLPRGEKCDDVEKPASTDIINTQAFWEQPVPAIYQETNSEFTAFMKFRDPITRVEGNMKLATLYKIGIYYLDGTVENNSDAIGREPSEPTDRLGFPLTSPRDYTGYLGYRIEDSNETDDEWYDIGEPCEFRIWWTDAGKPGVSIEVDKKFVVEGSPFRVTATATPAPNRDIVVPITLSDTSRITDLRDFTVRIAAGQPSGYTDIRTRVIPGDQPGDDLTVSAEWRSTYWMDETVSSRNITLTELKLPELSIRAAGAVTEANFFAAAFTVTSDIDPADAVEVHYTPTETGDFLVAPVPDLANRTNNGHLSGRTTTVTLNFKDQSAAQDGSGPFEAPLTVPLRGNTVADAKTHSVTVTLNTDAEGADYEVSASGASASVAIIDDETLPVLTLEPDSNPADFDEPDASDFLTFKVTASAMPRDTDPDTDGAQIDVRFTPAQTGDFVNDQTENITLGEPNAAKLSFADDNGVVTADLAIPILADDIEEPSGSVSVTLLPADVPEFYYVLSEDAAKSAHSVKLYDDDETELSVSVAGTHFVEGSEFAIPFTVTSRFTTDNPLTVNFKVEEFEPTGSGTPADAPSEQNEFLGAVASPESMDFSSSTAQGLGIPIVNDGVSELSNRFVRVTLLSGADYTVADAAAGGSATILVVDNDAKPLISLSALESVVESAGRVDFTVSALVDPGTIRVNFRIADDEREDYLPSSETGRTSEILTLLDADSDGTYTAAIEVLLDDDGIAERTGVIAMSLAANTADYNLGTVTIATVKVYDDDAPELTITGGGAVTEGNPGDAVAASFIVESQALPNEGESDEGMLTVLYTPVSDDFLAAGVSGAGASANLSFTDASGAGDGPYRAELSVAIDNDEKEEENGTVQVFLQDEPSPGTSYFVAGIATNMHFASVDVIDNDSVVVLSVADASGAEGTDENGFVEFTVTASKRIPSGFTVEWVVNTGSALGTAAPADLAVASLPHTGTVTFAVSEEDDLTPESVAVRIPLAADDQDEGEETFTLTLTRATGTGATEVVVSRTRGSATGTIRNDDGQSVAIDEIVIDVPSVVRVYENTGEARIALTLNATPEEAFTVTASTIEIPAGTIAPTETATAGIDFIPYAGRAFATSGAGATVSVKLVADSLPEGNEKFFVEISTSSGASILGANSGTKRVEVVIIDESQVPVVEVTVQRRNIFEGNAAEFAVVASAAGVSGQGFEVPIRVTQTGDYLSFPVVETVAVSDRARILRFATADDREVESNGIITLTLLEGTGYRLHSQRRTDFVNVVDNDRAGGQAPLYSVVSSVITEILSNLPPTNPSNPAGDPDRILVSVSAVENAVNEGDPIRISVSVRPVSEDNVAVMLALEETGDYLGESGRLTVTVPAGSASFTLEIPTVDDDLAEDNGLVTVSILQSEAYSTGSRSVVAITVTDEEDNAARREQLTKGSHAVLPEIAGSIGARSHGAMNYRMTQAFSDAADPAYQLGGQSSLSGLLTSGGRILNGEDISWEEVLGDASFSIDLLPETSGVKTASVWGVGDFRNPSGGRASGTGLSGDGVFTGHVGVDTLLGKGIVAGVMTSASSTSTKFGQGSDEVKYRILTTGVQPYFGIRSDDGDSQLDIVAGYGLGEAKLDQAKYDTEILQTAYYNAGLSGSGRLYSHAGLLGGTGQLNVEGDSWFARQFLENGDGVMESVRTDAGHARLALAGSQDFELEAGEKFGPNTSIGLRADEKGQQSFVGMELLFGLEFQNPFGLTLAGDTVMVVSNGLEVRELELSGSADFDRDRDERGLMLSFAPKWGQVYSETDSTLWSDSLLSKSGSMGIGGEGRSVSAEISYGLDLGHEIGRLTPYAGLNTSDGTRRYNVGSRLGFNSSADLQLEFGSRSPSEGESTANLMLDGTVRW